MDQASRGRSLNCQMRPPSTTKSWQLTKLPSSLARRVAALADVHRPAERGVVWRGPVGLQLRQALLVDFIGVCRHRPKNGRGDAPGEIVFTPIPGAELHAHEPREVAHRRLGT